MIKFNFQPLKEWFNKKDIVTKAGIILLVSISTAIIIGLIVSKYKRDNLHDYSYYKDGERTLIPSVVLDGTELDLQNWCKANNILIHQHKGSDVKLFGATIEAVAHLDCCNKFQTNKE